MSAFVLALMIVVSVLLATPARAEESCTDQKAVQASDALGKQYFRDGKVFHKGKVFKHHSPSGIREVASYIQTGELRYSIFTLVDPACKARFMKRTRQND